MESNPEYSEVAKRVIFNEGDLLRRVAHDRDLVRAVLAAFDGDIGPRLKDLDDAVQARDVMLIRRIAHTLKGAAANVSADGLVATAQRVEDGVQRGDWAEVVAGVKDLRTGVENFRAVLSSLGWLSRREERPA